MHEEILQATAAAGRGRSVRSSVRGGSRHCTRVPFRFGRSYLARLRISSGDVLPYYVAAGLRCTLSTLRPVSLYTIPVLYQSPAVQAGLPQLKPVMSHTLAHRRRQKFSYDVDRVVCAPNPLNAPISGSPPNHYASAQQTLVIAPSRAPYQSPQFTATPLAAFQRGRGDPKARFC